MGAERIPSPEMSGLSRLVLTFRTVNGDVLAWNIGTHADAEKVPKLIEAAANEWLLSPAGSKFVHDQELAEWGFDYWHALDNIPHEVLSKYDVFLLIPADGVIELEPDENLLPQELRK